MLLVAGLGLLQRSRPLIRRTLGSWYGAPPDGSAGFSPFRGPLPFVSREDKLPGREDVLQSVVAQVEQHRLLILEGQSGVGKTSFLRAALAPAMTTASWDFVYLRPEQNPLGEAIHAALGNAEQPFSGKVTAELLMDLLRRRVSAGPLAVGSSAARRLLLCIDQFEDTLKTPHPAGLDVLFALAENLPANVHLLLALRSDYSGALARSLRTRGLPFAGRFRHMVLEPFSRAKAVRVIQQLLSGFEFAARDPARVDAFARALTDELIHPPSDPRSDTVDYPHVLPFELQLCGYVLQTLCDGSQDDTWLTPRSIARMGGRVGIMQRYLNRVQADVGRFSGLSSGQINVMLVSFAGESGQTGGASLSLAELGMITQAPPAALKLALDRLCDAYVCREVAAGSYQLIHDHLKAVLSEVPQPELQDARLARSLLAFWEESEKKFHTTSTATGLGALWRRTKDLFRLPIPLLDAWRVRKVATGTVSRHLLARSFRAAAFRVLVAALMAFTCYRAYLWHRQLPNTLVRRVLSDIRSTPRETYYIDHEAVSRDPLDSPETSLERIGAALIHMGRSKEAIDVMRDVSPYGPTQVQIRFVEILIAKGHLSEAREILKSWVSQYSKTSLGPSPDLAWPLVELHLRLHGLGQAKAYWEGHLRDWRAKGTAVTFQTNLAIAMVYRKLNDFANYRAFLSAARTAAPAWVREWGDILDTVKLLQANNEPDFAKEIIQLHLDATKDSKRPADFLYALDQAVAGVSESPARLALNGYPRDRFQDVLQRWAIQRDMAGSSQANQRDPFASYILLGLWSPPTPARLVREWNPDFSTAQGRALIYSLKSRGRFLETSFYTYAEALKRAWPNLSADQRQEAIAFLDERTGLSQPSNVTEDPTFRDKYSLLFLLEEFLDVSEQRRRLEELFLWASRQYWRRLA